MADGGNQELFQALQMFGDGFKAYGLSQTINEANDRAKQLKNELMPDMIKRQALSSLANDVTMRLAAAGADATAMNAVHSSIAPPVASNADQAILLGTLNGDQGLIDAGKTVRNEQDLRSMADWTQKFKMQEMMQDRADARAQNRAARVPKALDTGTTDKLALLQTSSSSLNSILARVDKFSGKIGPVAGRLSGVTQQFDPDFAAFTSELGQYFDAYRHAVTGAGAGQGELRMLEKNVPNIHDRPEVIKSKIKAAMAIGQRTLQTKLQFLGRSGRDVSGFTDLMVPDGVREFPAKDLSNFLED